MVSWRMTSAALSGVVACCSALPAAVSRGSPLSNSKVINRAWLQRSYSGSVVQNATGMLSVGLRATGLTRKHSQNPPRRRVEGTLVLDVPQDAASLFRAPIDAQQIEAGARHALGSAAESGAMPKSLPQVSGPTMPSARLSPLMRWKVRTPRPSPARIPHPPLTHCRGR